MSRQQGAEAILAAAETWKQQCLLDGGSLFSDESLWTRENFDQLRIHFVDNVDDGPGDFYEKLEQQLAPSSPEAKRLWAEMTWALFLIVSHDALGPEAKRDRIRQVWEWSGSNLPDDHWALGDVLAKGVVNPNPAYNINRWRECRFFITTMISWFFHSSKDRESRLTDPWGFAEWLDAQEYCQGRQFRHAFLFLLFPDEFEPIMSPDHKKEIVKAFSKKWDKALLTNSMDSIAWDQALQKVVAKLQVEYPEADVHFYKPPLEAVWRPGHSSSQSPPPQVRETAPLFVSYSIDNILEDGCFLQREKLETILHRLRNKKNLILQGPPGTGKTWLAKKLAFAAIGERDEDKIRPVQFHPNLSYEDFVRGWRPSGDGKLDLVDGPFLQMINTAKDDPESKYAIIIEEINRGNPAQIFGEMLTLLESDKRNEDEALELSYRKREGERVYIPENLYVIGTMNVADRSIAMVDFALRRRFAFVDLEPIFGNVWRDWVHNQYKIDEAFLSQVEDRMNVLNEQIAGDSNLGAQFRVGHSYVTPSAGEIDDFREWFKQVVETEIGPLLDEYWFDALDTAQKAREQLLEGL